MSTTLYPYYEAELHFIRKSAQEFARKYPVAAARLQLENDRSADPHVERLIEAFALLTARIRNKLHDEFPELTDALLSVLYPHALTPIPSFAAVQFQLDAARGIPEGITIPAGSPMHTSRVGDQFCKYRTCYPVKLWPIALTEAKLHPPPFPPGVGAPPRAVAALRLRFQAQGELPFEKMKLDRLRLHLVGDGTLTAPLYDLIFNHVIGAAVMVPDKPKAVATLETNQTIFPVGFDPHEGLIPYPAHVFPGYRLLTEYFSFPAKFLYVDLGGWDHVRRLGAGKQLDFILFLNRSHTRLEQLLEPNHLRTGCTPVVNLFEPKNQTHPTQHQRTDYRVVPDVSHPTGYEIHSIESVTAASPEGGNREFRPFYHFQHGMNRDNSGVFWYSTRRESLAHDDRGTDVDLHLIDTGFDPLKPTGETVVVRTLCTNRDLPMRLPRVGDEVRFETAFAAPGTKVRCVRNPTGTLRSRERGRYWHLISHLNLNHLSLTGDPDGTDALKGLLKLYDLTDPEAEPQAAALARQSIEGIERISNRRVTEWIGSGDLSGFARGLEVTLELDETKFVGGSGFLFASVLERFFGLYVSVNSFTKLATRYKQQDGVMKRWPPRAGDRPLG